MRTTFHVDGGDPHNDQVLAHAKEDLDNVMEIVRDMLCQAEQQDAPLSSCVAALAISWIDHPEAMTRERLASLLALALIQAHAYEFVDEQKELKEFIRRITGK